MLGIVGCLMIWDSGFGNFFLLLECCLLERSQNLKHEAREVHEKQNKKGEIQVILMAF